jgi:hypothetical protein
LRWLTLVVGTLICLAAGAIYLLYWQNTPKSTASTEKGDTGTVRKGEWFNSAGGISQAHSSIAQACEKCHDPTKKLSIDTMCQGCHNTPPYNFHQTNVVTSSVLTCTECHHEHLGTGPMQPVADSNCASCHANATLMAESAQISHGQPATMQPFHKDADLTYFCPARPASGFTTAFQAFDNGHPNFEIQRENLSDPDTLKFNHKFHFGPKVRHADGSSLSCQECHKPDSTGAYMQKMTFAQNCQECHALKIDPTLKDFVVPHPTGGSSGVNTVRNFLLTLPTQYANYATEVENKTSTAEINAFVAKHMTLIQQRVRNGENLENEVFLSDGNHIFYNGTSQPAPSSEKPLFAGCALCHDVATAKFGEPKITPPVIPDRWYVRANFNHAAHAAVRTCEECHTQTRMSEKTSDILLPDKASCVECHSVKGGVVSTCTTCHDYHNSSPSHATASLTPLRQMMLGKLTPWLPVSGHP